MFSANNYTISYNEDFVVPSIKCPPPKIVAVKRSLKSRRKRNLTKNIMDDEDDSDVKDELLDENEFESSDNSDAKDLIEFEKEEPLIDLSEDSNDNDIRDTKSNSGTITMLLDLLEFGSIMKETTRVGSCAHDDDYDTLPTLSKRKITSSSSSSSLNEIPLDPGACAHEENGKLEELSSIPSLPQPLSAVQPENPSIVKNYSIWLEKSQEIDEKSSLKSIEGEVKSIESVLIAIDTKSNNLNNLQEKSCAQKCEKEKSSLSSSSSIFTSISQSSCVNESSKFSCCSIKDCSCSKRNNNILTIQSPPTSLLAHECDYERNENNDQVENILKDKEKQKADDDSAQLLVKKQVVLVDEEEEEESDKNNNRESVCNQNFSSTSSSSSLSFLKNRSKTKDEQRRENSLNYKFLSPNTSQRLYPPKFFSSTNSLNQENCFEASTRLKRLEERFKGFSYTKKLLCSSKVLSKSEETLSSYRKDTEFKSFYSGSNNSDSLNSSSLLQFPLTTSSTFSENSLSHLISANDCDINSSVSKKNLLNNVSLDDLKEEYNNSKNNNNNNNNLEEDKNVEYDKRLPSLPAAATLETLQRLQSPESSTESDEICKIFLNKDKINFSEDQDLINNNNNIINDSAIKNNDSVSSNNLNHKDEVEECEEDCSFVYFEEEPGDRSVSICEEEDDDDEDYDSLGRLFNDISFSNCEFDVQTFNKFLKDDNHKCNSSNSEDDDDDEKDENKSDESDFFCDCLVEAVPLYHKTSAKNIMRETGAGKLRGLLKQPNRPAPTRKNRVVFDETRNEFFEADYIILIREDCPYDEEDEEPCTCGDHELVRICCDEGCNCGYTDVDDGRTPPSPKYAPPIEFVDQATLSPPEGYKDGSLLDSALSDALSNHVFGAQHIQQLQVIQRLQQQRAAMLAARAAASVNVSSQQTQQQQQQPTAVAATAATAVPQSQQPSPQPQQQQQQQQQSVIIDPQQQSEICPECTQCSECAAAKLAELEAGECDSQCSEEASPLEVPAPHVLAIGSLVPVQKSSPERRNQKEIVAGEERPKFLATTKTEDQVKKVIPESNQTSYVVETITTTTTVTEQTIIRTAEDSDQPPPKPPKAVTLQPPALPEGRSIYVSSQSVENMKNDLNATIIPKFNVNGTAQAITGILKGGKLRKTDSIQNDETNNTTSDEETSSKRSVRFNEETGEDVEIQTTETNATDDDGKPKSETQLTDYVTHMSLKRHSSLFHNALRPNSAVRQLFPAKSPPSALTHEALKAFEESKRSGNLLTASQTITSAGSASSSSTSPTPMSQMSSSDTDTIKRTIERNALRRSLIKYEPKKKVVAKDSTSLEERIRQLTCDIDEPIDSDGNSSQNANDMERRDSPAGEETPQQTKFDKSFSPSSSASSSSSCSTGSTYKKITDLFNKEKRQEKIPETDENPIVIQDCRCGGPDLGMGVQIQHSGHSHHSHQPPPPPPRSETTKRQFLNTLAPLTACVAGQRDDNFSYYIAAKPGDRTSTASSQTGDQYSIGDIDAALQDGGGDGKKIAPDVILSTCTPGEQDELVSFAQQEANRMDRIKKRYSSDSAPPSGVNSDDDEQNDYGFNKRPSVRGIKPRFGSTNEILQQMQDQLSQPNVPTANANNNNNQSAGNNNNNNNNNINNNNINSSNNNAGNSQTLPRTNASGQLQLANSKQQQQQQQQQQHQHNTGSWSYYPDQGKNYYHLPAHARHSYHGEAIYQNCHTMTVQQTQQAIIQPGHVHQKLTQQPHAIHAIQHAQQQINRFSHFARSPTRRPESPPPLKNYHHQTMVLIPYKTDSNGGGTYATYGIAGDGVVGDNNIYQRQHNIVEYQQVTQQTIRVPIGYPLPGMQLHVVRPASATPHYATLPRQNSAQGANMNMNNMNNVGASQNKFIYPDKPMESRGVPEGEASVQQGDCSNIMTTTCQDGESNNNNNNNNPPSGTVYYAMNV